MILKMRDILLEINSFSVTMETRIQTASSTKIMECLNLKTVTSSTNILIKIWKIFPNSEIRIHSQNKIYLKSTTVTSLRKIRISTLMRMAILFKLDKVENCPPLIDPKRKREEIEGKILKI